MLTAGAADWVVVGAVVVVDVVGGAWCRVEWQPHITAPSRRTLARLRVPIEGLLARWPARAPAAGIGDEPFHHTFIREIGAPVRDTHLLCGTRFRALAGTTGDSAGGRGFLGGHGLRVGHPVGNSILQRPQRHIGNALR